MLNFAVIGVGGYIAPRHLEAIHAVKGKILSCFDPNDSVGILDRYSPDVEFFTKIEEFEESLRKKKGTPQEINYLSICSPNFLHFDHIKLGLLNGADVICEKPLVFTVQQLEELKELERITGKKVNTILQLRLHPKILEVKNKPLSSGRKKISLNYVTSRGPWYHESWKGDIQRSGGLSTNIGVHFFDMLSWIWGKARTIDVHSKTATKESGLLILENADVQWMLSIALNDVPEDLRKGGLRTYRSLTIDGEDFEFSDGFTELHNQVYHRTIVGNGFGIDDIHEATRIVEVIRNTSL